jgi:hypothetical protein
MLKSAPLEILGAEPRWIEGSVENLLSDNARLTCRKAVSSMSFRDLHYADEPLRLPNAWDVPSALAFYDAGCQAIGTTSFGLAASAGHPDGGRASKELAGDLVATLTVSG